MSSSNAIGNKLSRIALAVGGAKKYAAQLPKEAVALSKGLEADQKTITDLNVKQEGLKSELAKTTLAITTALKGADVARAKVVRLAEATFGPNAPEIKEFRPATEGKVKVGKAKA